MAINRITAPSSISALKAPKPVMIIAVIPIKAEIPYKIRTACLCEKPISISLWCKCPRSGDIMGFLFFILLKIAVLVSNKGSATIKSGTANEMIA